MYSDRYHRQSGAPVYRIQQLVSPAANGLAHWMSSYTGTLLYAWIDPNQPFHVDSMEIRYYSNKGTDLIAKSECSIRLISNVLFFFSSFPLLFNVIIPIPSWTITGSRILLSALTEAFMQQCFICRKRALNYQDWRVLY